MVCSYIVRSDGFDIPDKEYIYNLSHILVEELSSGAFSGYGKLCEFKQEIDLV
jgi:hypothetical protein